jgi:hypothetical protein
VPPIQAPPIQAPPSHAAPSHAAPSHAAPSFTAPSAPEPLTEPEDAAATQIDFSLAHLADEDDEPEPPPDYAREYVGPKTPPALSPHITLDEVPVRLAKDIDPKQAETQLSIGLFSGIGMAGMVRSQRTSAPVIGEPDPFVNNRWKGVGVMVRSGSEARLRIALPPSIPSISRRVPSAAAGPGNAAHSSRTAHARTCRKLPGEFLSLRIDLFIVFLLLGRILRVILKHPVLGTFHVVELPLLDGPDEKEPDSGAEEEGEDDEDDR